MIKTLHVKKVVILDFQEPYSLGLSDAVESTLKAAGVRRSGSRPRTRRPTTRRT